MPGRPDSLGSPEQVHDAAAQHHIPVVTDVPRARAFVFRQLGPLASPDGPAERLRETVLAFLAACGSATRVAREPYVHQNTVVYRVKRAEELLRRRVTQSPVELICALTLAAALGPAVLCDQRARREW